MDFNNREEVYQALRNWMYEAGEDILDGRFGADINIKTFMAWAVGAGYITPEKFNMWYNKFTKGDWETEELNLFLYDDYGDVEYAIIKSKDGAWHEEEYEEAFKIIAHFVTSFKIYQERLRDFLEDEE